MKQHWVILDESLGECRAILDEEIGRLPTRFRIPLIMYHLQGISTAEAARQLQAKLDEVLNSDHHKWFIGKMSAGEVAARKAASEQFKKRYAQ